MIQIAGAIEIDEEIVDRFELFCKPQKGKLVSIKALEVNGRSIEEMTKFPELRESMVQFRAILDRYVSKFDSHDKFVICGYNVGFDYGFLRSHYKIIDPKYGIGAYIFNCHYDVRTMLSLAILKTGLRLENYKLSTACNYFGIELNAHDAGSDIQATIMLDKKLTEVLLCLSSEEIVSETKRKSIEQKRS
jgi:DNA polymerase III epsilon subunit-like protein